MDHALGVDDNGDVVRGDPKQMHGLHEFEALVHHGRAVDGDLRAHAPVGVPDRLLGCHVLKLCPRLPAEGAAGAGQQDLVQLPGLSPHEALEDGRVLGVHRDDLGAHLSGAPHDDLARADKGLLVGKGDALSPVDGGEGGFEADGAGDRGHDAVGLRECRGLDQALHAGAHADIRVGHGDFKLLRRVLVVHGDEGGFELSGLLLEQVDLSLGGQGRDAHADVLGRGEGLPADGAGAAQDGNGFDHVVFPL